MNDTPLSRDKTFEILSIGAKLNSKKDLEVLLEEIQLNICSLIHAEAASIFVYNEVDDMLHFLSLTGEASDAIRMIKVPMHSIAGRVYTSEAPIIVNDTQAYKWHFKGTDDQSGFQTKNILAVPLKTEKVFGVLEVVNKKKDSFTNADLESALFISKLISYKIVSEYNRMKLSEQMKATIESISTAIDLRDNYTNRHSRNVADLSKQMAKVYGLDFKQIKEIEIAALLHDLGKIGISDSVLLKPGMLDKNEYERIREHPSIGKRLLEGSSVVSEAILRGIQEHHEKLDGTGYPQGLKEKEIHIYAKIIAVADIYDALLNKRVYKEQMPHEKVFEIINDMVPEKLDPEIVGILKDIV